ncbi:hypothetical protein ACFYXQ_30255 [Nocardia jiangxiensis]|uniref:Uncharacterized protein n=1 Tax=Nocardia jiangxiensis TaxID=282685 RepID=A0ABW6S738_9NOCA
MSAMFFPGAPEVSNGIPHKRRGVAPITITSASEKLNGGNGIRRSGVQPPVRPTGAGIRASVCGRAGTSRSMVRTPAQRAAGSRVVRRRHAAPRRSSTSVYNRSVRSMVSP